MNPSKFLQKMRKESEININELVNTEREGIYQ